MTRGHDNGVDPRPHVIVVDDEEANRQLLREVLTGEGYRVSEAHDGDEALVLADTHGADSVLMDVMMPGLDGVTACRCLKASPGTAAIPVILVTAQRGRQEKIEGIAAGANDFLSKPLDLTELRLKVRNAVQTKSLHDRAEAEYRRVLELEQSRDNLVHMVVHDMRSVLTAVLGELELLELDVGHTLDGEAREGLWSARRGASQLTEMANTMLDLSKLESGEMPVQAVSLDVRQVLERALATLGPERARVRLEGTADASQSELLGDAALLQRVFANLVGNALDYSPPDDPVVVGITNSADSLRITVTDRGPGISPADRARIFQKFGQVEGRSKRAKPSTGMGLAFCRLAVHAHGGAIGVEDGPGRGSTFFVELPAQVPSATH